MLLRFRANLAFVHDSRLEADLASLFLHGRSWQDVLKGTRSAARKVDAVWLAFAAGLLPRPRSTAAEISALAAEPRSHAAVVVTFLHKVAMFAFFYRQARNHTTKSWECDGVFTECEHHRIAGLSSGIAKL